MYLCSKLELDFSVAHLLIEIDRVVRNCIKKTDYWHLQSIDGASMPAKRHRRQPWAVTGMIETCSNA